MVELVAFLCDVARSQSFTRYYRARRMGGTPSAMGWESQAVLLVPRAHLRTVACHPNDQAIRAGCLVVREALGCYAHGCDRTWRYARSERGKGRSFIDCGPSSITDRVPASGRERSGPSRNRFRQLHPRGLLPVLPALVLP